MAFSIHDRVNKHLDLQFDVWVNGVVIASWMYSALPDQSE